VVGDGSVAVTPLRPAGKPTYLIAFDASAYPLNVPFVTVDGVDVHYVELGSADAEHTVVVLHGFPIDQRLCVATFEPSFRQRPGWRRIYPDFPGMGQTRAPDWVASTNDIFKVTQDAVNALVPGRYALAGTSYGGYVAMGIAEATPDRVTGLALIVPVIVAAHEDRDVAAHQVLVRDDGLHSTEMFEELAVVVTADTLRRHNEQIEPAVADADQAAVDRISANYAGTFPLVGPSYERPSLVVLGRQDNVLGFNDQWHAMGQWPRATFVILDRAGHALASEQPALLTPLIDDWLDRILQVS